MLRHTFCARLAMKGASAKPVRELAGHADIRRCGTPTGPPLRTRAPFAGVHCARQGPCSWTSLYCGRYAAFVQ